MSEQVGFPNGARHDPWRLLFARWKLAGLLSIVFFSGFVALIQSFTPLYKANVELLLPLTSIEDPSERKGLQQLQTDAFVVRSYKDMVEDGGVCQTVIDQLHLSSVKEFQPQPTILSRLTGWFDSLVNASGKKASLVSDADIKKGSLLSTYEDRLTSKNDAKSLILDLSFESANPYLATSIANAHAEAFRAAEVRYRRQEALIKTKWMKAELDRSAEEVRQAQIGIQLRSAGLAASADMSAKQASSLKFDQMMATSKQAVYEAFLTKYQSIAAEQSYVGSEIRILSPATVPTRPAFPKKLLFALAAAAISVCLGVLVSVLVSVIRRRQTIVELAEQTGLEIVGYLNVSRRRLPEWRGQQSRLKKAFFWEQIREIRSALTVSPGGGTVIAVTSALPLEGKSLVAAALARSLACSGLRTLLLDTNLRKPSFYALPETPHNLCSYFEGHSTVVQASASIDPDIPLFLLSSAIDKRFPNPDVLGGPKMRELLKDVRDNFDVVIVDTPAISIVSDALFAVGLVDQVLLAALDRRVLPAQLAESIMLFRRRGLAIRGMIVTQRKPPARSAFMNLKPFVSGERLRDVWPVIKRKPFPWRKAIGSGSGTSADPIATVSSFAKGMASRMPS